MAKIVSDDLVVVTGPPCIGKTTLLREAIKKLQNDHNIICNGFYTQELRSFGGERIGFDSVNIQNGRRAVLARKFYKGRDPHPPKVGKYSIYVPEFNEFVSEVLVCPNSQQLMIIDEVGRMELKSRRFEQLFRELLSHCPMLVTLPCNAGSNLPFIQALRDHDNAVVFEMREDNRNRLLDDVVSATLAMVSNRKL